MIYLITDNYYLAVGIREVYKNHGEIVSVLPLFSHQSILDEICIDGNGTYLISIHNLSLAKITIKKVNAAGARFCFFIDKYKKDISSTQCSGILYRGLKANNLINTISALLRKNTLKKSMSKLTNSERIVMDTLSKGHDIHIAALKLDINIKTAYNYRLSALTKIGIKNMNAKSMLIYRCVSNLI